MNNILLNPTGFLFAENAQNAIAQHIALPFIGQSEKLAFSMVEMMHIQKSEIRSIADIIYLEQFKTQLDRLATTPPLAGLPAGPLIMGILNVTPDSFSDGGKHYSLHDAVEAGYQMVKDGADIIDIGGESTRPGSQSITVQEECRRILPVICELKNCGAYISVDTRNAETMRRALEVGADLINDITALDHDESLRIVAQAQCPVILMHMRGSPQTMHHYDHYNNVVFDVYREMEKKIEKVIAAGIRKENIIIDPGIGFAKNFQQNIVLLKKLPVFANFGCRLLLAVSRKRFIKEIVGSMNFQDYDNATMIASSPAYCFGNSIIRVHNVPAALQTLKMWHSLYS